MSYWDRDWVCSDCKTEALSKTRTCPKCGKARPYPKASEAGPTDVTQELIKASEEISRRCKLRYSASRDCYYINLNDLKNEKKEEEHKDELKDQDKEQERD